MPERLVQRSIEIAVDPAAPDVLGQVRVAVEQQLRATETPIRLAVINSEGNHWTCELGTATDAINRSGIFGFTPRTHEDAETFNVVMLVPTGIGAEIGGHAGDATPAATLLASVCDTLITHPNVLNASDIIQIPNNALYVEGSLITQLMMGTIELHRVRNNRLLVLVQAHEDEIFTNAAINSVNAARALYGLRASIVQLDPRFRMISEYTRSGIAAGRIEGIEYIYEILDARLGQFDAVALTSVIELPSELHQNYYRLGGEVVNPWGGVEAMLTHAISMRYGLPSAHAPMLESREIAETDFGVVDPRMAAEVISLAFLQCVLRGLQRSPAVTPLIQNSSSNGIQTANVSCLVVPDGCIGLPTLTALHNGIPVIAVKDNKTQVRNSLASLPWRQAQLLQVNNYLEAAGVVAALRVGITPESVLRPFDRASIEGSTDIAALSSLLVPIAYHSMDGEGNGQ